MWVVVSEVGSQNAELALVSPPKRLLVNLSDLDYTQGGCLACRIGELFT